MKYIGMLYGRCGGHYFPLDHTSEDVDATEEEVRKLQELVEIQNKLLTLYEEQLGIKKG